MKLLYDVQKASITRCIIYHLHYKDKLNNLTQSFIFIVDNLHFLYSLSNLLIALVYITKLGLVIKKEKLLRTSLHLLSYQLLFLFPSLTLLEICLAIFEYLVMSQYVVMYKWQNIYDNGAYATESSLVNKKKELPRTFIYLFSDTFQLSSLIFSSMLSKICLAIYSNMDT